MSQNLKRLVVVVALVVSTVACTSSGGSSSSGQVNLGGSCSESSGALKWSQIGAVEVL